MGRPQKITPELSDPILTALRLGATDTAAAGAVGASVDSLRRAAQRNANFASELTRARAEGRLRLEKLVLLAAETDGRLALEALARRYPEDWGRRDRLDQPDLAGQTMHVTVAFDKPEAFDHPEQSTTLSLVDAS